METGEVLCGRYRIARWIASGGMGEVFEAVDEVLEQAVALKRVSFAGLPDDEASRTRARTLREARLAARLRGHPQVVAIYDVVEADGDVWLVLEYLPSRSLSEALGQDGRLDPIEAARVGAAVAGALAAAHGAGVLHRDVKPGNVLIGEDDGVVKLTDFGISRADGDPAGRLTATDVVSGTPAYMAREVARGDEPTAAADVYALGATLYRAVEGRPPYGPDTNALRLMYRVATEPLPPPEHAQDLEPLLMRLLEADPATRPDAAQARDLLDDFARRPFTPTVDAVTPGGPVPATTGAPRAGVTGAGGPGAGGPGAAATVDGPAGAAGSPPDADGARPAEADDSGAPPGRPWWRRRWALVVAALVVVLAVATGVLVATTGSHDDPAALPDSVAPVSVGDPTQADPCALVDTAALGTFGSVRVAADTGRAAYCNVDVYTPSGAATLGLEFLSAGTRVDTTTSQTVGAVTVRRAAEVTGTAGTGCPRGITLTDGTHLDVQVSTATSGIDPCAIAETTTAGAVRALAARGVTPNPARAARVAYPGVDTCALLTPGDLTRTGTGSSGVTSAGFARWSCYYPGPGQVTVWLAVDGPRLRRYGTETQVDGRRAFVSPDSAECSAWVLQRPYDPKTGPARLVEAIVGGTAPDRCGAALTLASAAASRLP